MLLAREIIGITYQLEALKCQLERKDNGHPLKGLGLISEPHEIDQQLGMNQTHT